MIGLIFLSIWGNYLMQYFKERNDWNSKPKDDFWNNDLKYNLFLVIGLFAYHLLTSIQAVIFLFLLPWYWWKWNRQYKRHRNVINILQEEGSNHSLVAQGNNEFEYEEHPNHEERLLDENQQLNPNEMRVAQFLDFVVEIRQGGIPFNTDLLRRITVEERQNMVPSMWTICYYELNEDMYERLIYLPCNQNHVFHEMCILMWFENNRSWPICESVVNQEEVERYARNN